MIMTPALRKFVLTLHVISSVGSLGAVAVFLVLGIVGLTSHDAQLVRAAYRTMELIAWFVIIPLVLGSLLSGLIQSLGTSWGLFRYWWILAKLLLTVLVIVVLMLQMNLISDVAELAAKMTISYADFRTVRISLVFPHAGGGLIVLVVATALSVYKPQGLTRYGWRKRHQRESMPGSS